MKYSNKILGTMLVAMAVTTSCVDDDKLQYAFEKPASIEGYEYLAKYDALKSYESNNSKASSDFKLGVALAATDYNTDGLISRLANSNFEEVVAGNEMKMGSIVNENGEMDFSTVETFVRKADEAGLNVYGHTLAWHAQQPVKWLNKLLKDKEIDIDPDKKIETEVYKQDWTKAGSYSMWGQFPAAVTSGPSVDANGLTLTTTGTTSGFWELQYMVADGISLEEGGEYLLRIELSGTPNNDNLHFVIGPWGTDVKTGAIDFNEKVETREISFTAPAAANGVHMLVQSGDYVGTYTIKCVTLYKLESPAVEVEEEVNFYTYENMPDGPFPHYPMGVTPPIVNGALHYESDGNWNQFFVVPGGNNVLEEGDYIFYVDMAANKEASGVQLTVQNGWGGDAQNFSAAIPVEAGRHIYALKFPGLTGSPSKNYDVILKPQTADVNLDFYSLKVNIVKKLNSIPLTPEEKKDTLTWAMDKWISGMMEACNGKVKAWDAVNEAISGGDPNKGQIDEEGVYKLQHADEENPDPDSFFWQDYLGDLDYVRTVVRLAREYGPEDIKLFINDYNLESDWDQNNKAKSLVKWIERWEADGVTKIDGIGTQMHIWCYSNEELQKNKKDAIDNMFKELVKSGKLIRVSELDMGYTNGTTGKEEANMVATANMTEEQHKKMAELYNYVIKSYFENVPVAQQWGICQWCATDSPSESAWRKNQPTGLWDLNYNRKHTYAGFATGIAGAEYEPGK